MAKHYVKINGSNVILHAYSDAFEEWVDGDPCVNEDGSRHFHLNILDVEGLYNYKWVDPDIVERTPSEKLSEQKELKKEKVKMEAFRRIVKPPREDDTGKFLELFEWKQRNYITRCLQLIKAAIDAEHSKDIISNLTTEEQAEYAVLEGHWDEAVAIRTASNTIEGLVDGAADKAALDAIDIQENSNWPTE